jgi:beta-barrel assembly-enhancing protease
MRKTVAYLALLAMAPLALGGCVAAGVVPMAAIAATGAYKAKDAARPINDSEEYYVGRAVAARIFSKYPLSNNVKLTQYVNEVGQTVARKSPRPNTFRGYHFAVLESPELNAFACPGGTILITKGLVMTCADEDQLAAVLAHEVSHVVNKDGINSISKARWTEVFTAMGSEAAKQYGGGAGYLVTMFEGSIDDVFKTIVVNGYSRTAEDAADHEGVATMTKAGYDPKAMVQVLQKMTAKEKGASGGIYKTHPPTAERLAKVKAQVGDGQPVQGVEVRTQRFKGTVS